MTGFPSISAASEVSVNGGRTLVVHSKCDFQAVRCTSIRVRDFLLSQGVSSDDAAGLELALVEAFNNAVEHVGAQFQNEAVTVEAQVLERRVNLRVFDHTPGFEWPNQFELPDPSCEGGRGLFLIQTLTDEVEYFRGSPRNVLCMSKACLLVTATSSEAESVRLRAQVAESDEALLGMTEELSRNYETLTSLFRYSTELASARSLPEFAGGLLRDLAKMVEADAVALRLLDEEGGMLRSYPSAQPGLSPVAISSRESIEAEAASSLEDQWFDPTRPLAEGEPLRMWQDIFCGVSHALVLNERLLGTITLGRRLGKEPFRAGQISVMHTLGDFLAIQVANERLHEERTQTLMVRRELEIAASIQRSMLPAKLPEVAPYSIAASCVSAREVGGDFYDAIPVGKDGILLVIADVMGKGIPAALLGAILRSVIHSMPQYFDQPAILLSTVNRVLYDDFSRVDMFATVALGYLDLKSRKLCVANAGHPPVLVARGESKIVTALASSGPPIGVLPSVEFCPEVVNIPVGSRLLFYTDGLTELGNAKGEMFGDDCLEKWLQRSRSARVSAGVLAGSLAQVLDYFRAGTPARDDQTFILVADQLDTP